MTVRTLRFFLRRRPRTVGTDSTWQIYYVVY
jgi:hypothetical protein